MNSRAQMFRSLFLGGVLPVVAFTVIEEYYGIVAGLIAGMAFGVIEISWEWITQRKVEPLTWGGNGLILVLGGVALFTSEGIWFKLQPALIEAVMAFVLWGSFMAGRPLMVVLMAKMMKQQGIQLGEGPHSPLERMRPALSGMTLRLGIFFALHAALATWAAFRWSTTAWALLKGAAFTVSMIVYVVVESVVLRYRIASTTRKAQ